MAERISHERSSTEIPTSPIAATGISPDAGSSIGDREAPKPALDDLSPAYDSVVKSEVRCDWQWLAACAYAHRLA